MPTKLTLTAFAAFLTVAAVHGTASAQGKGDATSAASARSFSHKHAAKAPVVFRVPANAFGAAFGAAGVAPSVPAAQHRPFSNNINPDFQLGGDF